MGGAVGGVDEVVQVGPEFRLLDSIQTEGLKASTVAPVGVFLWKQVSELSKLNQLSNQTLKVINDLRQNRDNLEYCRQTYHTYWTSCSWFAPTHSYAELSNEQEFEKLLATLQENTKLINDSIANIQRIVDGFGIALISVNIAFVAANVHFYVSASADVQKYQEELTKIQKRLKQCADWFSTTNQDQDKRTHFYANVSKIINDFNNVKLKLETLRSSAMTRIVQSVGCATLVTVSMVLLPVSTAIYAVGIASSAANVASAGLCWKVVDSIDRLIPHMNEIIKAYEAAIAQASKGDNSLPIF